MDISINDIRTRFGDVQHGNANWVDGENRKFAVDGLKAIEAFCNDILQNLQYWSVKDNMILYKTETYVYVFNHLEISHKSPLVQMTRFNLNGEDRIDDYANVSSVKMVGIQMLRDLQDKRVYAY